MASWPYDTVLVMHLHLSMFGLCTDFTLHFELHSLITALVFLANQYKVVLFRGHQSKTPAALVLVTKTRRLKICEA